MNNTKSLLAEAIANVYKEWLNLIRKGEINKAVETEERLYLLLFLLSKEY